MLVVLRLALGWHFLYEGMWKIAHADSFVGETEGFLSAARGPFAGYINRLVPDIDGHQRLEANLNEKSESQDANGKTMEIPKLAKSWDLLRKKFTVYYCPQSDSDEQKALGQAAAKVYDRHVEGLNKFIKENGDKIKAHFESLSRFEAARKTDPSTAFLTQRRWDEQQDLRKEAKAWCADLDSRENALKSELLSLLVKPQASVEDKAKAPSTADFSTLAKGRPELGPFTPSSNPLDWKRTQQMAFALTWTLFGVGLCLMLGLFTRPAAIVGACFLVFVLLSQPAYPGVFPIDPPQLGHAWLVNKDFIELTALLVISTTAVGTWGGLDFFLHNCIFASCRCKNANK